MISNDPSINQSLLKLFSLFRNNTYQIFYENDLQSLLFTWIYEANISIDLPMTGSYHNPSEYGNINKTILTSPIKTEYPSGNNSDRFDIAVLHDGDHSFSENPPSSRKNDLFWSRYVKVAIELKLGKLGDNYQLVVKSLVKDIKKLQQYAEGMDRSNMKLDFLGMTLLFIQPQSHDTIDRYKNELWQTLKSERMAFRGITNLCNVNGIFLYVISAYSIECFQIDQESSH